jgi:hypothetical protein
LALVSSSPSLLVGDLNCHVLSTAFALDRRACICDCLGFLTAFTFDRFWFSPHLILTLFAFD